MKDAIETTSTVMSTIKTRGTRKRGREATEDRRAKRQRAQEPIDKLSRDLIQCIYQFYSDDCDAGQLSWTMRLVCRSWNRWFVETCPWKGIPALVGTRKKVVARFDGCPSWMRDRFKTLWIHQNASIRQYTRILSVTNQLSSLHIDVSILVACRELIEKNCSRLTGLALWPPENRYSDVVQLPSLPLLAWLNVHNNVRCDLSTLGSRHPRIADLHLDESLVATAIHFPSNLSSLHAPPRWFAHATTLPRTILRWFVVDHSKWDGDLSAELGRIQIGRVEARYIKNIPRTIRSFLSAQGSIETPKGRMECGVRKLLLRVISIEDVESYLSIVCDVGDRKTELCVEMCTFGVSVAHCSYATSHAIVGSAVGRIPKGIRVVLSHMRMQKGPYYLWSDTYPILNTTDNPPRLVFGPLFPTFAPIEGPEPMEVE